MEKDDDVARQEATEIEARRKFLKTAAKVAVTAPAVTLLVAAPAKSQAGTVGQQYDGLPILPINPSTSDLRLKRDVRRADMLPNGIQLYSFRYWNDDRTFVGVIAQELLEDERFRGAVIEHESGYYMVDLDALGLEVEGPSEEFFEAGQNALNAAGPVVN